VGEGQNFRLWQSIEFGKTLSLAKHCLWQNNKNWQNKKQHNKTTTYIYQPFNY
jgi:hypothetical protein